MPKPGPVRRHLPETKPVLLDFSRLIPYHLLIEAFPGPVFSFAGGKTK